MTPQQQMKAKLSTLSLARKDIECFGSSVIVRCMGFETAEQWARVLDRFCRKVKTTKTSWHAKNNQETCLRPTLIYGFLIGGTI